MLCCTFELHPVLSNLKYLANKLARLPHFFRDHSTVPQKLFCALTQTLPGFLDIFSPNLIAACCVHSPICPEVYYEKSNIHLPPKYMSHDNRLKKDKDVKS